MPIDLVKLKPTAFKRCLSSPACLGIGLVAFAASILLTAFVIICVHTGTAWPWTHVVHEDGRRTLVGTILYFEHATRELPLDVILGIAIGGCVFLAFPPVPDDRGTKRAGSALLVLKLALTTAIVLAVILIGTALKGGTALVMDELLQNHTRFGVPLEFGSHWRYHLLERLAMILCSLGFAGLLRLFRDTQDEGNEQIGLAIAAGSIGLYIALTIAFSRGYLLFELKQPFRDPRYLGHQAREVLTHALVTLPIAWGVCLLMLPSLKLAASARSMPRTARRSNAIVATIIAGVLGLLLAAYVSLAALLADATSHGQTTDPVTLIFPHFFEHSFTYLVVPMVAALVYETAARFASSRSPPSYLYG
jgi:hypothetical protein